MNALRLMTMTALALMVLAPSALALGPLDANAALDLNSKYVWRGMVSNPDPVLQPSVGVSLMGFGLGFWGNLDMSDANGLDGKLNEVDWTLGYGMNLPLVELNAGLTIYDFPNSDAARTTELSLGVAANVPLSPSLTIYRDLDEIEGTYWEAGIHHAVSLRPGTDLELSAGLGLGSEGYVEGYFGPATALPGVPEVPGGAHMTDYHLTAGLPFHPIPLLTVTPRVTYSTLTGDVKDIVDGSGEAAYHGESDVFFWGVNAALSF